MLRNYLKIAWRSLWKNKTASVINIIGLSIGLGCCLIMILYMNHELSYDKFHAKGDRIVRVIMEYSFDGGEVSKGNFTSSKVAPSFKKNFPEVIEGVRMEADGDRLVKYGTKLFNEKKFLFADPSFFKVFSFRLIKGNPNDALNTPNAVVITRSAAEKYFGTEDPMGKVLQVGSSGRNYIITGITENCPSNSQIKFDFLASFSSLGPAQEETYFNANYTTYLLLRNPSSISTLESKIGPFMKREMSGDKGTYINYELEPFLRVHLYSPYDGFEPNSNIIYIYIIAGIALLVLIIACFTFINLSTARSIDRAKEVGIRKVSGAFRGQIFLQFIIESFLITTASLLLSFLLVHSFLPAFNQLSGKSLLPSEMFQPEIIIIALLLDVIITFVAGSYPAMVLSKFIPVKVLKSGYRSSPSGLWLRQSLIIFQFVISIFLVIVTIIISTQMHFIQHKKLGYDREQVILLDLDYQIAEKTDVLKSALKANKEIVSVSLANSSPVNIPGSYYMRRSDMNAGKDINTFGNFIDEEYIKTVNLKVLAGNNFTKQEVLNASREDYSKNTYCFIINESAAKSLGFEPEEAVGKKMFLGDQRPGKIKAVVKDFHFASLHNPIEPLVLFPGRGSVLLVKVTGNNLSQTLRFIQHQWKSLAPGIPFEYRFMDEDFNRLYDSEARTSRVFSIFSAIAILLACMGLFGLSAYSAHQRIKEIGIRKTLGATVGNITFILTYSFMKLVGIAFIIASPVAWFIMNNWIQDFAYRVQISWWMFALAGLSAFVIAFITVSFQAVKAAVANPVKSLHTD